MAIMLNIDDVLSAVNDMLADANNGNVHPKNRAEQYNRAEGAILALNKIARTNYAIKHTATGHQVFNAQFDFIW